MAWGNAFSSAVDGALKGVQIANAVSDAWDKYKYRSDVDEADEERKAALAQMEKERAAYNSGEVYKTPSYTADPSVYAPLQTAAAENIQNTTAPAQSYEQPGLSGGGSIPETSSINAAAATLGRRYTANSGAEGRKAVEAVNTENNWSDRQLGITNAYEKRMSAAGRKYAASLGDMKAVAEFDRQDKERTNNDYARQLYRSIMSGENKDAIREVIDMVNPIRQDGTKIVINKDGKSLSLLDKKGKVVDSNYKPSSNEMQLAVGMYVSREMYKRTGENTYKNEISDQTSKLDAIKQANLSAEQWKQDQDRRSQEAAATIRKDKEIAAANNATSISVANINAKAGVDKARIYSDTALEKTDRQQQGATYRNTANIEARLKETEKKTSAAITIATGHDQSSENIAKWNNETRAAISTDANASREKMNERRVAGSLVKAEMTIQGQQDLEKLRGENAEHLTVLKQDGSMKMQELKGAQIASQLATKNANNMEALTAAFKNQKERDTFLANARMQLLKTGGEQKIDLTKLMTEEQRKRLEMTLGSKEKIAKWNNETLIDLQEMKGEQAMDREEEKTSRATAVQEMINEGHVEVQNLIGKTAAEVAGIKVDGALERAKLGNASKETIAKVLATSRENVAEANANCRKLLVEMVGEQKVKLLEARLGSEEKIAELYGNMRLNLQKMSDAAAFARQEAKYAHTKEIARLGSETSKAVAKIHVDGRISTANINSASRSSAQAVKLQLGLGNLEVAKGNLAAKTQEAVERLALAREKILLIQQKNKDDNILRLGELSVRIGNLQRQIVKDASEGKLNAEKLKLGWAKLSNDIDKALIGAYKDIYKADAKAKQASFISGVRWGSAKEGKDAFEGYEVQEVYSSNPSASKTAKGKLLGRFASPTGGGEVLFVPNGQTYKSITDKAALAQGIKGDSVSFQFDKNSMSWAYVVQLKDGRKYYAYDSDINLSVNKASPNDLRDAIYKNMYEEASSENGSATESSKPNAIESAWKASGSTNSNTDGLTKDLPTPTIDALRESGVKVETGDPSIAIKGRKDKIVSEAIRRRGNGVSEDDIEDYIMVEGVKQHLPSGVIKGILRSMQAMP